MAPGPLRRPRGGKVLRGRGGTGDGEGAGGGVNRRMSLAAAAAITDRIVVLRSAGRRGRPCC